MTEKKSKPVHQPSQIQSNHGLGVLWPLEPRMMFDGAAVSASIEIVEQTLFDSINQKTSQNNFADHSTLPNLTSTDTRALDAESNHHPPPIIQPENELEKWLTNYQPPTGPVNEVVFVDTQVENYETILAGINPNIQIVLLDNQKDGVKQMADYLTQHQSVEAIHIISHGSSGSLQLGTGSLTLDSMTQRYSEELDVIKQALTEQADILVYGCDFAKGQAGQEAAILLGQLTGAEVAASDDLTGHTSLGGDWDLEVTTGVIESTIAITVEAQSTYQDVLDITSGLVGQWTFDTNANDTSGNGNHGTLVGNASINTTMATNIVGAGKLTLDGVDDEVDLSSHTSSFSGLTQGTIAAWVKLTATGDRTIFDIGDGAGNANFVSFAVIDGHLYLDIFDGGVKVFETTATASINDGNWHHVAFTVNGSGNQLYIDGTTATRTFSVGTAATTTFISALNSTLKTTIGAYDDGSISGEFLGTIDDLRVYNRALAAGDMAQL